MSSQAVTSVELQSLPHIARGKVRDLYRLKAPTLLMVVTDRISAYDEILASGIPDKGPILCQISAHWFKVLSSQIPELYHHCLSLSPPPAPQVISATEKAALRGRCMQIRKMDVFPVEVIVRGYITGSAWNEYEKHGTVHGMAQPKGLQRCQEFPGGPIYTPSTKAPMGEKDENISPEQARDIVGDRWADKIENLALKIYKVAHAYAMERGVIIADTKMEFAVDEEKDELVLVDEVLTPDSSRFWPGPVKLGVDQPSYDKQFVRNYLTENGLKGKPDVVLPDDIVNETSKKYREVFERITGKTIQQCLADLED